MMIMMMIITSPRSFKNFFFLIDPHEILVPRIYGIFLYVLCFVKKKP